MITAKVIADSVSPEGIRLTTMHLRYPRMVHADFMTHRVFSRNGRSSRAVPFATLVKEDPYIPHFMQNQPGMVASEELAPANLYEARRIWEGVAKYCQSAARELADLNVHKQWVNRMLEWFGYIDVLVTSTDWVNFFALRDEAGAQPEIQELARVMKVAMDGSTPIKLEPGSWHLPYISDDLTDIKLIREYLSKRDGEETSFWSSEIKEILKKVSVARCARLTIKPFDGDGSIEKELKRYSLLMESRPVHASPAEHIATPDVMKSKYGPIWDNPKEHGNFHGWRQFRKMIPHNTEYDR